MPSKPRTKNPYVLAEVPAEIYVSMFQGNPDGERILSELSVLFYDRPSVANANAPDPNAALYLEGQRSVLLFILDKCQKGQK